VTLIDRQLILDKPPGGSGKAKLQVFRNKPPGGSGKAKLQVFHAGGARMLLGWCNLIIMGDRSVNTISRGYIAALQH
jgi:hypothetical protein